MIILVHICEPDMRQTLNEIVKYKILRLSPPEHETSRKKKLLTKKCESKNNFLFLSMNMESVCSILSGLHAVFKDSLLQD